MTWRAALAATLVTFVAAGAQGQVVIDSAEIAASTAPTFSELLQSRRPGVRVFRSGGLASDGSLVMLRGPTTLIGPSTPIVMVDGVRVDSRQYDLPLASGAMAPSRLDDLAPEDIQRIEILTGPAAALYGEGAANGVILVTTKSGGSGPIRFGGRVTYDATQSDAAFPANYQRVGTSPSTGQPVDDCSLVAVARGQCTPTGLLVWNPLEQASPFRTGNSALGHVELGGTTLGTQVSAGLTSAQRQGALPHDDASRLGVRGKVSRQLPARLAIDANGSYLRNNARTAVDGNTTIPANVVGNGLVGNAVDDDHHGYATSASVDTILPDALLRHATGGVTLRWQPVAWLDVAGMLGRDRVTERWHYDHIGAPFAPTPVERVHEDRDLRTSGARIRASYGLGAAIAATTSAGIDRRSLRMTTADTTALPPLVGFTETVLSTLSTTAWLAQSADVFRQLHFGASLERVAASVFGADVGKEWFPAVSVAWDAPLPATLANLRLHAGYAQLPGETPLIVPTFGVVVPPFESPPAPRMERTTEYELGGDATVSRAAITLAIFSMRSTDLWLTNVPGAPGGGFGPTAAQVATMANYGVEAFVRTPLLDRGAFHWTGALSGAILHNWVTELRAPPQNSLLDPVSQAHAFGDYVARTYTYADANHDGIIDPTEVQLGGTTHTGPPLPTFESSFATDLTLPGSVVLSALLDYRSGNHVVNVMESFRCASRQICRETQDPSAPLALQAAAVARALSPSSFVTGYIQDGSFMRVREIAIRWTIPSRVAPVLGNRASLTFAGRNLATWTKYQGIDPETSYQPPNILPRQDFLVMPVPRELIVRLDVGAGPR